MIKKSIPHIFTLLNLFCGCVAVYLAFSHFFQAALLAVMLGVFFDFFDGFFARLLKVESDLGVQLDSLADMVTSGFVPGVVMYQMFIISGAKSMHVSYHYLDFSLVFTIVPLALLGFLIPLGAAFRLAKFNLITEKTSYFRGVPTPAIALLIVALPLFVNHPFLVSIKAYLLTPVILTTWVVLAVFFMNTHWKMIAFKGFDQSYPWSIIFPILVVILAIPMLYVFGLAGLVGVIISYIILSLLKNVFRV